MSSQPQHSSRAISALTCRVILWLVVILCCGLPLIWLLWQIAAHPRALVEMRQDSFRLRLLGRTLGYNGASALIATLMALPAGIVLGRGRGWLAKLLWLVIPIGLLLPSIAFAYGWKQCFRLMNFDFVPAGPADVSRCVWTLATWLWPLPAGIIGLSLRRLDIQVQEQAMLDGALWRITLRQIAAPILAGFCLVTVLATQEFAVYEPTGISVIATEMRMVFDTGAFSSPVNPITQTFGYATIERTNQPARAAAAVVTATPLLAVVAVLAAIALWQARRLSSAETIETGLWPRALDAPIWCAAVSWILVLITLIVPMASMFFSLKVKFILSQVWTEFSPQVDGSIIIALVAGAVGIGIGFLGVVTKARGATSLSMLTFLTGGPLLAIGLIRIYNRPWLDWVYNALPVIVMAYVARFGWIALMAGASMWSRPWRQLRELSSIDGASPIRSAISVILPIGWPVLAAAGVLVMILSLTEVPATVLLNPQNPQPLIPMLMTWVHMQRNDSMIEGSLLLCGVVTILGIGVVLMGAAASKSMSAMKMLRANSQ